MGEGKERLAMSHRKKIVEDAKSSAVSSASKNSALCHIFVNGDTNSRKNTIQKSARARRAEFDTWETVDGETCCLRLFELRMAANGDDDEQIVRSLAQNADGFLLVYSITSRQSFGAVSRVYDEIHRIRNNKDTPLVLVGNKGDAIHNREVLVSDGRDLAFEMGTAFYECSTKSDFGQVNSIFHDVIRQVRCVRSRSRAEEQTCNKVRGFIHRLSFKKRSRSLKRHSTD
ncbi:ras-related protein Rap-1-like isoform X2 [Gigantopelta aegis]|uniref:ras-related protein Rap-1-like isoform X2 n=1 Tax=Gigantopelta aegis TaxID=1735272 RepID=UPI001B88ADF8|nr:ras-related protein Rap-1-like isoform X2 [Gigantopelta aegis]